MNNGTSIALAIIVLALLGIYMQSKHVLKPAVTIITAPVNKDVHMPGLGQIAVASVGYLALLTVLPPDDGFKLTVLIALGALHIDYQTSGKADTISTLLG